LSNLTLWFREVVVDNVPDDVEVDAEVIMHQSVSHSDNGVPRN
jgi:hypothetical protein